MSMLTPENREKLLTEEKEYWQDQCLRMRAMQVEMASTIRKQTDELQNAAKVKADLETRLDRINTLHRVCALKGAPFTMSHPGNLTVMALEKEIKRAGEYDRGEEAKKLDMRDFFHVAWYHNGSLYLDTRCGQMTRKEAAERTKRLTKAGDKHKLYILDPMGGE